MSKPTGHDDTAGKAQAAKHHGHNRRKHPERPCPNPPAAPEHVTLHIFIHEQKTHAEYTGETRWDGVFVDEQGHKIPGGGVEIDHYELQEAACDVDGDIIETDAGKPLLSRAHKKAVKGFKVINATTAGNIATFTTKKPHLFEVGEIVRVQDVKPAPYNGRWTVLSSGLTATQFQANIGASPADLETEGTVEGPPAPDYEYVWPRAFHRPKKWYRKTRVRAWDNKQCASDWSPWTTPVLPTAVAHPRPPAPGFVSLGFDRKGQTKHNPWRGKVKISPVTFWDIPGGDLEDDMSRYHVKVQVSEDSGATWAKHSNHTVKDSDDEKDEDANILIVFNRVRRRNRYRVWLASDARYNLKGDYEGPYPDDMGLTPGGTPNPVHNVTVTTPAPRRMKAKWDEPDDPEDIDFYIIEWWRRNPLELMETNKSRNRNDVYRVALADKGKAHFAKVFAVDIDDNASTPIQPSDIDEYSDESGALPAPPGVPVMPTFSFDTHGTRHARYRAIITAGTASGVVDHYPIELAHSLTDDGSGGPPPGTRRHHGSVEGDATGDDLQEVFKNIPKSHYVWVRERARNAGGASAWTTGWVVCGRPRDFTTSAAPTPTGLVVTAPTNARILGVWDEPDDDEAVRWRVIVKQGANLKDTAIVRNNRHVYRVPNADRGLSHSFTVVAINDTSGESAPAGPLNATETGDVPGALPSPPGTPSNPSVDIDLNGTRHARYRVAVTAGVSTTGGTVDRYPLRLIHGIANDPTVAGLKRQYGHVEGDATGDDRTHVFRNIPKNHYVWVQQRAVNAGGRSAWTGLSIGIRPIDSGLTTTPPSPTGIGLSNPTLNRWVAIWDDPQDEEAVRWRVDWFVGSNPTIQEQQFVRNNRAVWRRPKAFRGNSSSVNVYAINNQGTHSSLAVGYEGEELVGDDSEIGSVKLWVGAIPTGWLRCNGASYSTGEPYFNLFGILGYSFGGGGGSFNIPDYRKRSVRGVGDSYGSGYMGNPQSLADTDGLAESNRPEQVDPHPGGESGGDSGGHSHGLGAAGQATNTAGNSVDQIPGGGGRTAAGYDHTHSQLGGSTGAQESAHSHNVGSDKMNSTSADSGAGHGRRAYGRGHYIIKYA